jgi:2-keto-3-deoxy-L-rhamnonate aldolase RhmA
VDSFGLFLFSTDPEVIARHVAAGVDGVVVDWETAGKEARQAGADTEINHDTLEDLRRVRAATGARVLCRVNGYGRTSEREVEDAIAAGADEILLPMVRRVEDVRRVLEMAAGRCGVGILVETCEAVEEAGKLAELPLTRVYVGLNDLAIARGSASIFAALQDGLVERIRAAFSVPFGFGGLTRPDCGAPIPCRLLIGEMARLRCDFSLLRRSYRRDTAGRDPSLEIPRVRRAVRDAVARDAAAVARDHGDLMSRIESLVTAPESAT